MITFDWVQPGVEVVERTSGGGFGDVSKIAKVHKTGHFTLDRTYPTGVKDTTKYRAHSNFSALSVGSGWHYRSIDRVTDELRVDIAAFHEYQRARKTVEAEIKRLTDLLSTRSQAAGNRDAMIAEAARIPGSPTND